jgi:hypothetical protein
MWNYKEEVLSVSMVGILSKITGIFKESKEKKK